MRSRTEYPEWVEKFRKSGFEIKHIKDYYYLYKYKTVYNKDKKKPQKVSGEYLGRITENGLVSKKQKLQSCSKAELGSPLEYGASKLLDILGADILEQLKVYFRDEMAETIFVIGKTGLIEPSPFKRLKMIYDNSYDSVEYPDLSLSGASMTSFLKELGSNRQGQLEFMKEFCKGSEYIIFDGTRLVSYSDGMDLARVGYNHCEIKDPQVNLLYCFSLEPTKAPVYFRANAGDKSDITTIKNAIRESGCKNVILIADKGFGSDENYKLMQSNGISYIIPLKRNDSLIDYENISTQGEAAYDGFFLYNGRTIFYKVMQHYKHEEIRKPLGHRGRPRKGEITKEVISQDLVITYLDTDLKNAEVKTFTSRVIEGRTQYTYDNMLEKLPAMGTMTIRSNLDMEPMQLYTTYKEREIIEDSNKAYKNELDKTSSNLQDDTAYYGWLFLNHISLMLYYRVFNCIKGKGLTSKYSPRDIMAMMRRITKQKLDNDWMIETGTNIQLEKLRKIFPRELPAILAG